MSDMSARHVEDIIGFRGLKRHEMSCLHDMSATCRGILVGNVWFHARRLCLISVLVMLLLNKCSINYNITLLFSSKDSYYNAPLNTRDL